MSSNLYNQSFVLYESVFRLFERLYKKDKAAAADYMKAVMEFGIEGILPDEDDIVWLYGLDSAIASIDAAKNKRKKNIEDGAKGGRQQIDIDPEVLKDLKAQGLSYQQMADKLGVSKSTIQRRFNSLVSNGVKCQNLNDNDNDNDNDKTDNAFGVSVEPIDNAFGVSIVEKETHTREELLQMLM